MPIIQKQIEVSYVLHFDYTQMNDVMMILKQFGCTVINQEMQLFCLMKIGVPINRLDEVLYKLNDMQGISIEKDK